MNRLLLILFWILLSSSFQNIHAQSFLIYGDWAIGSSDGESRMRLTYPGADKFYLLGNSQGDIDGDKTEDKCEITDIRDVWLICVDTSFNILWDKSIGGSKIETASEAALITSSGILFTTESVSDSSCEKSRNNWGGFFSDFWVYKSDFNGNKIWDKSFGGTANDVNPRIIQLSSGDFIVCGTSGSTLSGDKTVANHNNTGTDFWAIKIDSSGNKIWDKVYGGNGNEFTSVGYMLSILAIQNNKFIIAGTTDSDSSGDVSETTRGSKDIWILVCDSAGNKLWDKRFGGSGFDGIDNIITASDGGYLLAGHTDSPQDGDVSEPSIGGIANQTDFWVIKIDSLGNKQWDHRYGGNDDDNARVIIKDADSGYLVGGVCNSSNGFDVSEPSYGQSDFWVIKIDSVGNKIWDKRFGGPGVETFNSMILMQDSSILLAGTSATGLSATKTDAGIGGPDYWMTRFKHLPSTVGLSGPSITENNIQLYPNPTENQITIKLNNLKSSHLKVDMLDLMGRQVMSLFDSNPGQFQIQLDTDLKGLPSGVYLIKVEQERVITKRLIKL